MTPSPRSSRSSRADCDASPFQRDPCGSEPPCQARIVRDDDDRRTRRSFLFQHPLEPRRRRGVQPARGLVQQEQTRRVNQGPRQRDPLPLPLRVRSDVPIDECPKVEPLHRPSYGDHRVRSPQARRQLDVFPSCQVRVTERVVAQPPQVPPDLPPRSTKRPMIDVAGCGACERPENRQKGRLPRAIRTLNDRHAPFFDAPIDANERTHRAIRFGHISQINHGQPPQRYIRAGAAA